MFGRRRTAAATQAGQPVTGYHSEIVLVGDTDLPNNARVSRLFAETVLGLQGHSGDVVGYDQGDPAHSLNADLGTKPHRSPITANAQLGLADQITFGGAEYADTPSADPDELTNAGYRAALFYRGLT
jgi:hypothetical protein